MKYEQKNQIRELQYKGFGYKKIAAAVGLSVNTIKSYCRVHPMDTAVGLCQQCGEQLIQIPNRKKKRFCSDKCRNVWWSTHPEARKPKTLVSSQVKYTYFRHKVHTFLSPVKICATLD